MSGLRIHHPTMANCTLLIRHPGGPDRTAKDYPVHLDADGYSIVSDRVWQRLQEASPGEFLLVNEVKDPPTLVIGGAGRPSRTFRRAPDGISDSELAAVAQSFAPSKVMRPRITRKVVDG